MADRIPWQIAGTWIEACNCDFGCPCNFSGFPTSGRCEGNVGFRIDKGRHGNTALDGLGVAMAVTWPKAIHDGNGRATVYIDERSNEAQRNALIRILTGQDGGQPFEILAATIDDIKGPFFVPVSFSFNGTKSRMAAGGLEVELAPFTNPVTGDEQEVHTVLPTGFIWRDGNLCTSARNTAKTEGNLFDWTGKNAYIAGVEWSNA